VASLVIQDDDGKQVTHSRIHLVFEEGTRNKKVVKKRYSIKISAIQYITIFHGQTGFLLVLPSIVKTIWSSSQSQTSSIGIGEFGMNPAHSRGNAAAFSMAVKDSLSSQSSSFAGNKCIFVLQHGGHIHLWLPAHLLWCL
jgi:hypothetical protein